MSTVLESVFDNAPIGMSLVDLEWRRVRVNNAFCQLLGRPRADLIGTHVHFGTHPDDMDLDTADRERLLRGEIKSYQVQKRYVHAWGYDVWVLLTVSLIRDGRGKAPYVIAQVQNITEQKAREERLEHVVDHDFLTGLFNRRYFDRALEHELDRSRRYGSAGSILLVDLDHFKEVNDRLGHAAGDDLLKSVAATLKQHVRKTDVLARFGGDEFAILLPQTDEHQAQHVAEGLSRRCAKRPSRSAWRGCPCPRASAWRGWRAAPPNSCSPTSTARCTTPRALAATASSTVRGRDSPQRHGRPAARSNSRGCARPSRPTVCACTASPSSTSKPGQTTQYELLLRVQGRAAGPRFHPPRSWARPNGSG